MKITLPEIKDTRRAELLFAGFIMEKFTPLEFYPFISLIEVILVFAFRRLLQIYESRLPLPDMYEASKVLHETMAKTNELHKIAVEYQIKAIGELKEMLLALKKLPPK